MAGELEPVASALRTALSLDEPFRDPGVGAFGLENVVFALGDCFLEVVAPTQADTAAGRYLTRHGGDGGYMAIFDFEDLEGARSRALGLGVRVVWQIDLPDISGTHLHPADMRGAIVSLDESRPYGTWRWGGPAWTGQIGAGAAGRLAGIVLAVADPAVVAARWGAVLGVPVNGRDGAVGGGDGPSGGDGRSGGDVRSGGDGPVLRVDGGEIRFEAAASESVEGLVEIVLELPQELPGGGEAIELGGVRLRRIAPR